MLFLSGSVMQVVQGVAGAGQTDECLVTSLSSSEVTRKKTRPIRMPPTTYAPARAARHDLA
jgi:hypothetical protein